jgi:hypothetical protein
MATAEEVASFLAYEFLRNGNYSAASGPVEVPKLAQMGAAAADLAFDDDREAADVFANLAVQSVGHEEGVPDPKVHIYLTRGSSKLIKALPTELDGVPVRAHKMGAITVRPESAAASTNRGHLFERNSRVCCGSSCAPTSENISGTFGAIVTKAGGPDLFLLSNNHVFAGCNHVPRQQPILSPSNMDSSPNVRAPTEIGRHHEIHELRSGDPNLVNPCDADLAIAVATNPGSICSWQGDDTSGYDTPQHAIVARSNMKVKKFGRTTALTFGQLEAKIGTPQAIAYKANHFKGKVWFKDVWSIRAPAGEVFALSGDSGSLVVTEDGQHAVGLVFAANPAGDYALMIPMACVSASFGGLQLVGGHGV